MRPDLMGRYRNCLKLNWRMLGHLLAGRLLSGKEVAAGYNRLAAEYAENWLSRLRPVTEEMFALLPEQVAGNILDLGCGTPLSGNAGPGGRYFRRNGRGGGAAVPPE